MASDFAFAIDPVLFCRACGIEPDPWQAKLLRTRPGRLLLLASRQVGKSTLVAILVLWCAIFEPKSLIVVVSPSQRQSSELFRTVMGFYEGLEVKPRLVAQSALRAEFDNKSRILALPGTPATIRGIAGASMIVIDEAARSDSDSDGESGGENIMAAVRPMIATKPHAKIIALSTPAGQRGWFWEAWSKSDDWEKVKVPVSECPRITPEFLAEELRAHGPEMFRQEWGLEFLDDSEAVFATHIIENAFSSEFEPLWN